MVKYSCKSYAAVASLAASIHIHGDQHTNSTDKVAIENPQFLCLSFSGFSQFDVCTLLGLFIFASKYRSTSFASPMDERFPEVRVASQ
jgi:hypothetical protein